MDSLARKKKPLRIYSHAKALEESPGSDGLSTTSALAHPEFLLESADAAADPEAAIAWGSEIRDRIRAIDEGSVTGVAYEDVMRAAERRLAPWPSALLMRLRASFSIRSQIILDATKPRLSMTQRTAPCGHGPGGGARQAAAGAFRASLLPPPPSATGCTGRAPASLPATAGLGSLGVATRTRHSETAA